MFIGSGRRRGLARQTVFARLRQFMPDADGSFVPMAARAPGPGRKCR
jgi:hypothetical protein